MSVSKQLLDIFQRLTAVETSMEGLKENDLPHIQREIRAVRDAVDKKMSDLWPMLDSKLGPIYKRLNRYRPPWSVTIIFSVLSAMTAGLAVAHIVGK